MAVKLKVITYKGFKIQPVRHSVLENEPTMYQVFTKDEWAYGAFARSYEWEACSMKEAEDFIDSFKVDDYITLPNGQGAKLVDAEFISELYELGKLKFLGDRKLDDEFHSLYKSKNLPLVFYAVPVMQFHAGGNL